MEVTELAERIFLNLPYVATDQQIEVIGALAHFMSDSMPSDSVFLLSGYAGTGKTSLMGSLVKTCDDVGIPVVLMAPTGRAAKVFGAFARHFASTIHRRIYRAPAPGSGLGFTTVADNPLQNALFIVDEASMIGGDDVAAEDGRQSLLADLIYYVYSGVGCRMVLIGDTAQLPPVGSVESPAMQPDKLRGFGLKVMKAVLTATVRQANDSGILYNATWLRRALRATPLPVPCLHLRGFGDVNAISGEELEDVLSSSYSRVGIGDTILVTRSNRAAVKYNLAIRSRLLGRDEELSRGERLMVAKNNYLWSARIKQLDFIANGDIAVVDRIIDTEFKYGFRFADVEISLTDRDISLQCKIMLDTLLSETPALPGADMQRLMSLALNDPDLFPQSMPMTRRLRELRSNPYVNALQVKYAYAVTCHKSQGGQWKDVYVDMGYIPPEAQGVDFYRWLYTDTTRASSRLYYINPAIELR
ncbi:MAG: AAA family ATPase [Muribaculaceae bacterium]|nr:AAA family ATPase [Muribaculaceae bacterium]